MPYANMRRSPPSVKVNCLACGEQVSTAQAAQEVTGWLVPRKGGGPNHIRSQKPTGRYAHPACLDEAIEPHIGKQDSLF